MAIGNNSLAEAGTGGILDTATAFGANSVAGTANGYLNMAAVFGNMLSADATGGNVLIDIVTGVFSATL